jgi:chemotaxis methyl-accepting protein methylase
VAESLMHFLKPNGNLVIGHAESLHGISEKLVAVQPTIYAPKVIVAE